MKLPIKKIFFDKIKSGEKDWEYRDSHITFVCEETGEHLRKDVTNAMVIPKGDITLDREEEKCFDNDDMLLRFSLK